MTMRYLEGIAAQLALDVPELSYSDSAGGNVFVDWMPAEPMEAVALYTQPSLESDSKLPYDNIEFKLVVRNGHGETWGLDRLADVYSQLQGKRNVTLPDGTYLVYCIAEQSSPFRIMDDDNGRPRWSIDFRGEVTNTTEERP